MLLAQACEEQYIAYKYVHLSLLLRYVTNIKKKQVGKCSMHKDKFCKEKKRKKKNQRETLNINF